MSGVTLITPTGDRPQTWPLCCRWMVNQDFVGNVQWIIVDDGKEDYIVAAPCPPMLTYSPPLIAEYKCRYGPGRAPGDPPHRSHSLNLMAAMPYIKYERVLFIEDDDYYAPNYISTMAEALDKAHIAGLSHQYYYHVKARGAKEFNQSNHASLCCTGFRLGEAAHVVAHALAAGLTGQAIDYTLWQLARQDRRIKCNLFRPESPICVGMKGLPGRKMKNAGWHDVRPSYKKMALTDLIGEDADYYKEFMA